MTTAELRELLERATPGEWTMGIDPDQVEADIVVLNPDGPDTIAYIGMTYEDDPNPNLDIIVALHNVAPELLAIAEAGKAVVWFDYVDDDQDVKDAIDRLRSALAALEAK